MIKITLLKKINEIIEKLNSLNFQPLLVGGCIRDSFLGKDPKDIDIEILGCTINQLEEALKEFGKVDLIGKSFGILKIKGIEADFFVPRKENRIGIDHKEFKISFDQMTADEAALRCDLT